MRISNAVRTCCRLKQARVQVDFIFHKRDDNIQQYSRAFPFRESNDRHFRYVLVLLSGFVSLVREIVSKLVSEESAKKSRTR